MLKLKRVVFLLVLLSAIALNIDFSVIDAQTKKGGSQKTPTTNPTTNPTTGPQKGPRLAPLPVRSGVDYSKFDHASHSPDCLSCHIPNRKPPKFAYKQPADASIPFTFDDKTTQFPPHFACEECHFFAPLTLSKGFCEICHEPDKKTVLPKFPQQRDDQFGLKFPHDVHVGTKAKDYNVGPKLPELSDDQKKIQAVATSSGCNDCHVKEGKEQKEENFFLPYHPECARCHSEELRDPAAKDDPKFKIKNERPYMRECLECHKPFMAPRPVVSGIVVQIPDDKVKNKDFNFFTHGKSHEEDVRDKKTKKEKGQYPSLDCKFCHKDAAKGKRVQDIIAPSVKDACLPCHNDGKGDFKGKQEAHPLTVGETSNLRP
ncbi:MAG: hypothetical protein HY819_11180 [Acidobacteria bacterium]|nr:hypothetical protein [Acidobacteriota bacterium]